MDVVERLNEVKMIKERIVEEQSIADSLLYGLLPSGVSYNRDVVQTSPEDALSKVMAKHDEHMRKAQQLRDELPAAAERVMNMIYLIDNHYYRRVMIEFYIACKRMSDISEGIGYSEKHLFKVRNKCIRIIKNEMDTK